MMSHLFSACLYITWAYRTNNRHSTFNKFNQILEMFLTFDDISCGTTTPFQVMKKCGGTTRNVVKRKKHFQYLIKFIKCAIYKQLDD